MDLIDYLCKLGGKPKDKTWDEIGEMFGISGDCAKKRWSRYRLKRIKVLPSGDSVREYTYEDPKPDLDYSEYEPYKITTNPYGKDWIRYRRRLPDKESIKGMIEDVFKDIEIPELGSCSYRGGGTHIVALGDVHIGMRGWDVDQIWSRLNKILECVNSIKPENVVVVFGGDIIDGQDRMTTRRRHELDQDLDNREQLQLALKFSVELVGGLMKICPTNVVYVANSNHGGLIEYAVGVALSRAYSGVTIQEDYVGKYVFNGRNVLITHGYDEKYRRAPLPRFLTPRDLMYLSGYVNCLDYAIIRFDLHEYHEVQFGKITDILVPAFAPPSKYIKTNFSIESMQGFVVIDPGWWSMPVFFNSPITHSQLNTL